MTDTLDVLVIADDGDLHYLAVERALHLRGAQVKAWNLSTFRSTSMTFDGDRLLLEFPDGSSAIVDSTTTVWWRRVGRTPTEDLSTEEAALVRDENPHALIGCLDALGARWVDRPDVVARAERKLFQLAAMRANGIRTPRFVVTNSIEAAREFHKHDPVVTKALSPGEGIAPFTDRVTSHDIDQFIACNPTLLQEDVNALADLRVVVVGSTVMVWRRPRGDTTVDWRADDPEGTGFLLADEASFGARRLANLRDQALAANALLGLSVSVRDWLKCEEGFVFLEVNSQGNWLFLPDSEDHVPALYAEHLTGRPTPHPGTWPKPLKRFLFDFLPATKAPPRDGIEDPRWLPSPALRAVAQIPQAAEIARRDREASEEVAKIAEAKASRLLKTSLALIAIASSLLAYQINARPVGWQSVWALFVLASVVMLALAAIAASQIDRVGVYSWPQATDLLTHPTNPQLSALEAEERGAFLAGWSAEKKLSDLLQAWAWFSRGLGALLVAAVVAAATFGLTHVPQPANTESPSTVQSGHYHRTGEAPK